MAIMQLERLTCIASRYSGSGSGGRPMQPLGAAAPMMMPSLDLDMGIYSRHFSEPALANCTDMIPDGHQPSAGMPIMDQDKPLVLDLAMTAADQLTRMCHTSGPLWVRNTGDGTEVLDLDEHGRMFPWPIDSKEQHMEFRTEATRDSALVIMNSITLVDAFLDAVSS